MYILSSVLFFMHMTAILRRICGLCWLAFRLVAFCAACKVYYLVGNESDEYFFWCYKASCGTFSHKHLRVFSFSPPLPELADAGRHFAEPPPLHTYSHRHRPGYYGSGQPGAATTSTSAAPEAAAEPITNPILPGDFPDSSATRIGSTYWVTATTSNWGRCFRCLSPRT